MPEAASSKLDQVTDLLEGKAEDETSDESTLGTEVQEVDELLADDTGDIEADETEGDDETDESETDEVEAFGLDALAEKLGVEKSDLYEVAIPLGDGREPVTLGQLKDNYQDAERLADERTALDDERSALSVEAMRTRDEISRIASYLPDVPPELMQAVQEQHREHLTQEYNALLNAVPEWKDKAQHLADREAMISHLQGYGFRPTDLDNVLDHRLLKYVRDNMQRDQRIAKAKESAVLHKTAPKNPKPASKAKQQSAALARLHKAAKAGNKQAQVSLVENLIK